MNKARVSVVAISALAFLTASASHAKDVTRSSPEAATRTYAQNFKDMVFATCVANAYKGDTGAAVDAGSSVSALRDWTYYDLEKSPDAIRALVDRYLARDYYNPMVESETKGVKFDFLKCLDLYHSRELDEQAKRLVVNPRHTYRQDNPLPAGQK